MTRLYADEDSLDSVLASALRASGADVLLTSEAGMAGSTDAAQLEFAQQEGRALYTANLADFARLHAQWSNAGRLHAGIIVRTQFLYLSNWVPKGA